MGETLTTVLSVTKGFTTITFTLYGEMTDERMAQEKAILLHRLGQLS